MSRLVELILCGSDCNGWDLNDTFCLLGLSSSTNSCSTINNSADLSVLFAIVIVVSITTHTSLLIIILHNIAKMDNISIIQIKIKLYYDNV